MRSPSAANPGRGRGELKPRMTAAVGGDAPISVAMTPRVKYDLGSVEKAIDRVIDLIGPHPCISGFDVLFRERATLATLRDGQSRVVKFTVDPLPMLRALADGILLENPGDPGDYEIEITDEGPIKIGGMTEEAASQTVPFH